MKKKGYVLIKVVINYLNVLEPLLHVLGELPPRRDAQAALQPGRVRLLAGQHLIWIIKGVTNGTIKVTHGVIHLSEGVDLLLGLAELLLPLVALLLLLLCAHGAEVAGDDGIGGRRQVGVRGFARGGGGLGGLCVGGGGRGGGHDARTEVVVVVVEKGADLRRVFSCGLVFAASDVSHLHALTSFFLSPDFGPNVLRRIGICTNTSLIP